LTESVNKTTKPTDDDILRCRQRTAGAYTSVMYMEKKYFEFHDCGGQRPERARWESVIQQHKFFSILFFVAMEEYDVLAAEQKDDPTTKLELAKSTFTEFVKNREDKAAPIVLFLNKQDLLAKRIGMEGGLKVFKKTFKKFKGEADPEAVEKFIEEFVTSDVDLEADKILVHRTCALDTEAMKVVWESVREGILRNSFAKIGI